MLAAKFVGLRTCFQFSYKLVHLFAFLLLVLPESVGAYHLYENFGEKFPSNSTGIFLVPKTGTGLSCIIYKIPVNFSLSLDMKPGTSDPNKWYRKFRSFR